MKNIIKKILLVVAIATSAIITNAQTDYYKNKNQINIGGKIYTVDHCPFYILSNKQNTRINAQLHTKDGCQIEGVRPHIYRYSDCDANIVKKAILNTFTAKDIAMLKADASSIGIRFAVDKNGNVLEVLFNIPQDENARFIAPQKYYNLEQKLKSILKFTINPVVWDQFQENFIPSVIWIKITPTKTIPVKLRMEQINFNTYRVWWYIDGVAAEEDLEINFAFDETSITSKIPKGSNQSEIQLIISTMLTPAGGNISPNETLDYVYKLIY